MRFELRADYLEETFEVNSTIQKLQGEYFVFHVINHKNVKRE